MQKKASLGFTPVERCLLIGIMRTSNRIETRAQSRSVMLLKCSGLHAHYTDSANELLRASASSLARKVLGNLLSLSRDGD